MWSVFGSDSVFVDAGWFFSGAAVVTFGGAYAVLGYIAQRAVRRRRRSDRCPSAIQGASLVMTQVGDSVGTPGPRPEELFGGRNGKDSKNAGKPHPADERSSLSTPPLNQCGNCVEQSSAQASSSSMPRSK